MNGEQIHKINELLKSYEGQLLELNVEPIAEDIDGTMRYEILLWASEGWPGKLEIREII